MRLENLKVCFNRHYLLVLHVVGTACCYYKLVLKSGPNRYTVP
ncbi:MAG: hypothetical protein ACI8Z1_002766 [Candidatus Azotimanducaceae bacterium]|jgi:hypothetical protein